MVLAGYHRDLSTSGSWQDITSLFVISSTTPDRGTSWSSPITVLSDIDIRPGDTQALGVGLGDEYLHLLYQEYRDDVSGLERVGLMYTHGAHTVPSWSFQYSVGDEASMPVLDVLVEDGEDRVIGAWVEGQGKVSNVVVSNTNSVWSGDEQRTLAPGATEVVLAARSEGIYLYHDEINLNGPVYRMGLIADEDGMSIDGLSNMLDQGFLFGIGVMEDDTIVCSITPGGSLSLSKVASLSGSNTAVASPGLLETLLDYLPGDSREGKLRVLGLGLGVLVMFLVSIAVVVRRSRSEVEELLEEMGDEDGELVEVMITPETDVGPLLTVEDEDEELTVQAPVAVMDDEDETLAQELEKKLEEGEGNARLERRMKRKQQREMSEMAAALQQGLPPLPGVLPPLPGATLPPLDPAAPLPVQPLPLPDLKRDVSCPSCGAAFGVKDLMLKRISCPVCSHSFDL